MKGGKIMDVYGGYPAYSGRIIRWTQKEIIMSWTTYHIGPLMAIYCGKTGHLGFRVYGLGSQ